MRLWQRRLRAECDCKPELRKVEKTWGREGGGVDNKKAQNDISEKGVNMAFLAVFSYSNVLSDALRLTH